MHDMFRVTSSDKALAPCSGGCAMEFSSGNAELNVIQKNEFEKD